MRGKILTNALIAHWNSVVGARLKFRELTDTHAVFTHPTKGIRKISLKRLGLQ